MQKVDLILKAKWIIPMDHHDRILEDASVVIHSGKIIAIEKNTDVDKLYQADKTQTLNDHVLMPGFVNTHTHVPMNLLRGLADDLPLMTWLEEHIWPAEKKHMGPDFVRLGAELAIAEMIKSGTTCFNDMYFVENEIAIAAHEAGIRARVAENILCFETAWTKNADECIEKVIDTIQFVKDLPLVDAGIGPHAPYSVEQEYLEKAGEISDEYDVPIMIHLHETSDEVEQFKVLHRMRPSQMLDKIGLINHKLIAVHMTQANSQDRDLFAQGGAHIVHCPESNMKLSSGSCPVQMLLDAGINVALGTDGAASNNDLDMFGEMRSAALMAKLVDGNPEALPAKTVLKMATQNGSEALGYGHKIGTLEPGFEADIIAIDLNQVATMPVYNPISQLVYATTREQVTDVWVQGKQLLNKGELTTIDEMALKAKVKAWQDKMQTGKL